MQNKRLLARLQTSGFRLQVQKKKKKPRSGEALAVFAVPEVCSLKPEAYFS
jgi:hypothetical protein